MLERTTAHEPETRRRPARDLIEAVLENMRSNLEPLKYSTLVPARYIIYLHADEFARIEGIVTVLQEQTARALSEELQRLNRRPLRRYLDRFLGEAPPVENPGREWQIEFLADPDGELADGDILIQSDLVLAERPEPGAGQRTRRITTVHVGHRTTRREQTFDQVATRATPVGARLRYEDDSGPHTFDILTDTVSVGRGGLAHHVDVRISSSVDVSREHLRIRRDPSGTFFIKDLSTLGTTLDGRPLPRGFEEVAGARRENGVETALPSRARIGLAGVVFLEFDIVSPS